MKCDELTNYNVQGVRIPAEHGKGEFVKRADVDTAIAELKEVYKDSVDVKVKIWELCKKAEDELRKTQRALWITRAKAAKSWANYWFDVAPSENIKYDRIGRMEGVEKEFILTKVTKHMTASDWVGLWEKVDQLCLKKAEEYK